MLRFLAIKRLAVIDSVQVDFGPGMNVLSGETGAGKSILIEAVGLLLGGRASGDLVRTGEETATIEAIFDMGADECLVRREITAQGRSRAFINGELATVGALKDLAARLIELHGQHEHQTLLDPSTHITALDLYAGLEGQRQLVASAFGDLQAATQELARLKKALAERDAREELARFQLSELEKTSPRVGEDEELAAQKKVLANAERVQRLCEESHDVLYESDTAVLAGLGGVWRRVSDLASLDPVFQPYLDARDSIKGQLEDLALHLRRYASALETSPARLQEVEDRLAVLERLKRRHGPTLADVLIKQESLRRELDDLDRGSERLAEQEHAREMAATAYLALASSLSDARRKAARAFGRAIEGLLGELAMERSKFDVRFDAPLTESEWSADGIDRGEFFLSPNVGEEPRPLARIVSGGELSRVMLALKTLTAERRFGITPGAGRPPGASAPGLVFDEVDAGIGGRVADVVGAKLRALGSVFQVLCITHLPQIAAHADAHYLIEKQVEGGRTRTTVRRLSEGERTEEIGRMLGGANVTEQVRASAHEMLLQRRGAASPQREAKVETKAKGESESRENQAEKRRTKRPTA